MRQCPNCATELSSTATQCPKCLAAISWRPNRQPAPGSPESGDGQARSSANETIAKRATSFPIGFSSEPGVLGSGSKLKNTFRLIGKGAIVIDSEHVSFEGKRQRPFWFAVYRVLTFETASIVGVYRSDNMLCVQFAVKDTRQLALAPASNNKNRIPFITFWAADEAAATEIESLLPRCQPGAIARELVDEAEFLARLSTTKAYVTPTLVVANVLVFLGMMAFGAGFLQPKADVLISLGSNFGPLTSDGQWWRLLTSMFVHFGVIHLAINMWALYETGRLVERVFGNLQFLVLYLLSGLAGSLASLLWNPMVNSVGASGAIFGVFGALLAFMGRVPPSVMKKQRTSTLLFVVNSLLYGFTHAGVDNAAHIGGLAGGFLLGRVLARPLDPKVPVHGETFGLGASVAGGALTLFLLSLVAHVQSKNADVYNARGTYQLMRGNATRGLAVFDEAIRLNPRSAQAFQGRGLARLQKHDEDQAIADFDEALRLEPGFALAYSGRGTAWHHKSDFDQAISDLDKAISLNAMDTAAYRVRGATLFFVGRYEAAAADLLKSLELKPDQPYVLIRRYLAQARGGNADSGKRGLSVYGAGVDNEKWPAPVIHFLTGRIDSTALLRAAENPDRETRRARICEAEFYIGEWHLLGDRPREARALFKEAEQNCPMHSFEAQGASVELRRMAE